MLNRCDATASFVATPAGENRTLEREPARRRLVAAPRVEPSGADVPSETGSTVRAAG